VAVSLNKSARPSSQDCDANGIPDECELAGNDCSGNGIPDNCEPDSDGDGVPDSCDVCPGADDYLDSDHDGVPDCRDNCPHTPNPEQTDSDSDGVGDACDACPLDPAKTAPGLCGCGTADTDSDHDWTPDCLDGCPYDPWKTRPGLCGCGMTDFPNCVTPTPHPTPTPRLVTPSATPTPTPVRGIATFTVNSLTDAVDAAPGDGVCATREDLCTLRAAIQEANALSGKDIIVMPAGTYVLTIPGGGEDAAASGDLDILDDLELRGAGAATTIIDGNALDRIFDVAATASVTITGVTVQNGRHPGGSLSWGIESVGGILNRGALQLKGCRIQSNRAVVFGESTGGIVNIGSMTVTDSAIRKNSGGETGGIMNTGVLTVTAVDFIDNGAGGMKNLGTASVANSRFSGNGAADPDGGAIYNGGTLTMTDDSVNDSPSGYGISVGSGSVTLVNSTVIRNAGGGIQNSGALTATNSTIADNGRMFGNSGLANTGTGTLLNTTVSGNHGFEGGGIQNGGTLTLINSTVSGNTVETSGGGIYNLGMMHLDNATIADNTGSGGGVFNGGEATIDLANTIVAGNTDPAGNASDCSGVLESRGYNLIQVLVGCSINGDTTGNVVGVDPKLGPLQGNLGPTWTQAPLTGSPVIDGGNPAPPGNGGNACAALDQRGVPRPHGAACDIGAYEATVNCGNGRIDPPEECDDGNTVNGDCCSAACQFEHLPLARDASCDRLMNAADLPALLTILITGQQAQCWLDNASCVVTLADVDATIAALFELTH
jgi:CSLREA domain-containing protein